jgi:type IV pilus assembly protein PilA
MQKIIRGFTLIELMVVVMILGILATCAIPAYRHYVVRARVTEGLTLATSAKLVVSEALLMHQSEEHKVIGEGFRSPAVTENVASVGIDGATGAITVTFTPLAGNGTIIFRPQVSSTGQISWNCTDGTLESVYRPSMCR